MNTTKLFERYDLAVYTKKGKLFCWLQVICEEMHNKFTKSVTALIKIITSTLYNNEFLQLIFESRFALSTNVLRCPE